MSDSETRKGATRRGTPKLTSSVAALASTLSRRTSSSEAFSARNNHCSFAARKSHPFPPSSSRHTVLAPAPVQTKTHNNPPINVSSGASKTTGTKQAENSTFRDFYACEQSKNTRSQSSRKRGKANAPAAAARNANIQSNHHANRAIRSTNKTRAPGAVTASCSNKLRQNAIKQGRAQPKRCTPKAGRIAPGLSFRLSRAAKEVLAETAWTSLLSARTFTAQRAALIGRRQKPAQLPPPVDAAAHGSNAPSREDPRDLNLPAAHQSARRFQPPALRAYDAANAM